VGADAAAAGQILQPYAGEQAEPVFRILIVLKSMLHQVQRRLLLADEYAVVDPLPHGGGGARVSIIVFGVRRPLQPVVQPDDVVGVRVVVAVLLGGGDDVVGRGYHCGEVADPLWIVPQSAKRLDISHAVLNIARQRAKVNEHHNRLA